MNGHVWNGQDIFIHIEQTAFDGVVIFHQHASGNGKRTVKPGHVDHAAIGFDIELEIIRRSGQFRNGFDFKGRRISMRRAHLEMIAVEFLWNRERDDGAVIAFNIIISACFQIPGVFFTKQSISGIDKDRFNGRYRMEHAWTLTNELAEFFGKFFVSHLCKPPVNTLSCLFQNGEHALSQNKNPGFPGFAFNSKNWINE